MENRFSNKLVYRLCFIANTIFAATDAAGTFVSGVASTGLGGIDFGIRQIISAVMD